ncbi:Protein cortex, partial [Eumeta japonica]
MCVWPPKQHDSVSKADAKLAPRNKTIAIHGAMCAANQSSTAPWAWLGINSTVAGCSRGTLCAWSREARIGASAHSASHVHAVRVSPDARLLAAAHLHTRCVQLWTWPQLQLYRVLDTKGIVKTICWHPWRSALLSVGCTGEAGHSSLALWEAASGRLRHSAALWLRAHVLDAALYSPRTGELVLSLWYP